MKKLIVSATADGSRSTTEIDALARQVLNYFFSNYNTLGPGSEAAEAFRLDFERRFSITIDSKQAMYRQLLGLPDKEMDRMLDFIAAETDSDIEGSSDCEVKGAVSDADMARMQYQEVVNEINLQLDEGGYEGVNIDGVPEMIINDPVYLDGDLPGAVSEWLRETQLHSPNFLNNDEAGTEDEDIESATDIMAADVVEDAEYLESLIERVTSVLEARGYSASAYFDNPDFPRYIQIVIYSSVEDDSVLSEFLQSINDIDPNWDDIDSDAKVLADATIEGIPEGQRLSGENIEELDVSTQDFIYALQTEIEDQLESVGESAEVSVKGDSLIIELHDSGTSWSMPLKDIEVIWDQTGEYATYLIEKAKSGDAL